MLRSLRALLQHNASNNNTIRQEDAECGPDSVEFGLVRAVLLSRKRYGGT